ncbi:alpha/beta hydrolase family protein [Nocardioides carbamazepini]|uniref:alpha/beta hydrolase family protein n=1 Tax=Nocardioides carbamazepini TaxID=2854259 RepID=UPI002149E5D0|nr:alpha/beta hydrolase family protein [Nocardioides carbamazepini]MCR1786650.1 alpha/beta hydrolase family protein [Nocardioides carbamazepini]
MTIVQVPAHVPACPLLDSKPAGAQDLATDLRAVTIAVKNVQDRAASAGAPAWAGDAADAHDHASTRFAARLDAGEAALDRAVTAADRFGERLAGLLGRRDDLTVRRNGLNDEIDALAAEVVAATGDDRLPEFRQRAAQLTARADDLRVRIAAWGQDEADAETDLVAALRSVDTTVEGRELAADPARPGSADLARRLRALLGDPAALAAWWRGLRRAEQEALTTEHPELVGNAGGVPVSDRDEANRGELARDLDLYAQRGEDGQLTHDEKRLVANASHVHQGLEEYRDLRDTGTGTHLTELIAYTPGLHSGDGGVAVSFGDPDTAGHVSVNVPGLTTEAASLSGNLDKTLALHQAAVAEDRGSVASVHWADYDAPSGNPLNPFDPFGQLDFGGVALSDKAEAGGERLSDFVDGIRASDQGAPAHLTAIGHSYGSTTLGHALTGGLPVDDAVLLGSPGVPAATAGELTSAEVWVGSKDHDPVTLLGGVGPLGQDPADDGFGGTRFETGDGALRAEELLDNHTSYFEGASLDNVAHVVAGAGGEVSEQPPRGAGGSAHLTLSELLVASSAASVGHGLAEAGTWLWEQTRFGGLR